MSPKGFTLVELIVVVLILAVLGISVYPNINSSGFSAVTDQNQVISLLRNVQQRAMQNTQDGICQGVYFDVSNTELGLATETNGICNTSFAVDSGDIDDFLRIELENSYSVSPSFNRLEFDDWGRPIFFDSSGTVIGNTATITIDGTHTVTIESQGYIHD